MDRFFNLKVHGLESLPDRGPFILAANHHNYLDGVLLAALVPYKISFIVMPRVYHATLFHPLLHRWLASIKVHLHCPDIPALRRALTLLAQNRVVGIFPEGPYSTSGRLERGLPGVAFLALHSGAPVVPVAIRGTYEALLGRPAHIPRRHPVTVRFGPGRLFVPSRRHPKRAERERVTADVMSDIGRLLTVSPD